MPPWCPFPPEKPGVSGRGGGPLPPTPMILRSTLRDSQMGGVTWGACLRGEWPGPAEEGRGQEAGAVTTWQRGGGLAGGVLCVWHHAWELHPGMFSKRSDGGIPTPFQDFILPSLKLGWGERRAAEWTQGGLWEQGAGV